ncbi:MAG: hypothetical protein RIR11_4815 [Bacteroidota bacterium]|jgi:hypothetical protein
MTKIALFIVACILFLDSCLPPSTPYPYAPPDTVVAQAQAFSDNLESYIVKWTQGLVGSNIPDNLIPKGISDSKNFYLKDPDNVTSAETWAVRYAKPINKDSLLAGIPDPRVTYLFLGTALAPFGSKVVIEGEFPHCRFFSIQATPPLNGKEYYSQRQFGTAEVSFADSDIEPLPGHTNPFRSGANRNATNRKYRVELDLTTGDPTTLNEGGHDFPYLKNNNNRKAGMMVYQGPLGHKTVAGTPLPTPGDWNLGCIWIRIYAPDDNAGALGGVPMPKVWFELPNGAKYFVGSDFTELQKRADISIANRVTDPANDGTVNPQTGWFKSWGITRSMLNGVCLYNNWSRPDSGARVNQIDLGWTGRGEFQPAPGNIEPHATTNNYATYMGRSMTVAPGMVAVLTGKMPTFPATRNGEAIMGTGQVRYWSIVGIDPDALSPLPATTLHAISDDDVVLDNQRNFVIAYSRPGDRPSNAQPQNGVSWVDWGTQSTHGFLWRWVSVSPDWTFPLAPQENHLDWAHSDWSGSLYDSTLIGVNWRNGFMQCYLPKIHYMTKAEFEALGNNLTAEKIPVWVDNTYKIGPSEGLLGTLAASSLLDNNADNAVSNANDGNYNTAWSSGFGQQNATITLDLGSEKVVSAVKLYWDWVFFAKNYTLDVSNDNTSWSTIATAVGENGQIDLYKHLQNVKARFVRLNLTAYNAGWYRLAEFEVYTNDCNCSAPTSSTNDLARSNMDFRIYPNPIQNQAIVELEGLERGRIQVFNLNGKLYLEDSIFSGTYHLDMSKMPAGIYMVLCADDKGWSNVRRVVKVSP